MKHPVIIATKGRAGKSSTIERLIAEGGTRPILVVEPQDREAYYQAYAGEVELLVMDEDDQGITYARPPRTVTPATCTKPAPQCWSSGRANLRAGT